MAIINSGIVNLFSPCRKNKVNRSSVNRKISQHIVKMSAPQMQTSIQEDKVSEAQQRTRVQMQNDQNRPPVDRLPMVTMLLRACRDGNEVLIKAALRDVIINGITKEQLNLTDKSGRVSQMR